MATVVWTVLAVAALAGMFGVCVSWWWRGCGCWRARWRSAAGGRRRDGRRGATPCTSAAIGLQEAEVSSARRASARRTCSAALALMAGCSPLSHGLRRARRDRGAGAGAAERLPRSATASTRRRSGRHGRTSPPSTTAKPAAEQRLYGHVTTGRKARFDDGHEEDHPVVKTSDPKRIRNLVDWILALPVAAPVDVKAAEALASQSRCLKCHAVDVKKEGPAWKDVAAKYLGSVGAEERLYAARHDGPQGAVRRRSRREPSDREDRRSRPHQQPRELDPFAEVAPRSGRGLRPSGVRSGDARANGCRSLEAAVGVMRRAGALGGHHARADRVLRRADRAEQLAVARPLHAAQDRAAFAGLVVGHRAVRRCR